MGETVASNVHDRSYAGAYGSSQSFVSAEKKRLEKTSYLHQLERAEKWCQIATPEMARGPVYITSNSRRHIRERWKAGLSIYNKAFMYLMLSLDIVDPLPLGEGYGLELREKAATRAEQRGHGLGDWSLCSDMNFYNGMYPTCIINGFQATCIHCGQSVIVDVHRKRIYGMPRMGVDRECHGPEPRDIIWTEPGRAWKTPDRTDYVVKHAIRDLPGASIAEITRYCVQTMQFKGTYGKVYKSVNRLRQKGLIRTESVRNSGRWLTACYRLA
jgi:hypothetical protein